MRNRTLVWISLVAVLVWAAAFASAQNANVQITKGPVVENVTGDTATIAWSTNVNAGTILKYGTDRNNLNQTAQVPWGGITHRVSLKNLQPNTTYYFDVESTQGQGTGTGAISSIAQFQTQGGANAANPGPANTSANANSGFNPATFQVIAGPMIQHLTDTSAVLWWETNQPIQGSTVKFGTSQGALNQTAQVQASSDGMSHKADLSGLQPGTQYYVSVVRPDGQTSTQWQFKTFPANYTSAYQLYFNNGPVMEQLGSNSAIIAWSTNAPSSSQVLYGTAPDALTQTAQAAWGGTNHRVTLNNLQPNTKYYFRIQSAQAQGTGAAAKSDQYSFQTQQPGQAALNIATEH